MVELTRLSHLPFVLNCDLIEQIETTPDTVISLTTGQKIVVCETPGEIIHRVMEYKRSIIAGIHCAPCDERLRLDAQGIVGQPAKHVGRR